MLKSLCTCVSMTVVLCVCMRACMRVCVCVVVVRSVCLYDTIMNYYIYIIGTY